MKTWYRIEKEFYQHYSFINVLLYLLYIFAALMPTMIIFLNSKIVEWFSEGINVNIPQIIVIFSFMQLYFHGSLVFFIKLPQDYLNIKITKKIKNDYFKKISSFSLAQQEEEKIRSLQKSSETFITEYFALFHFEKYFVLRLLITVLSLGITLVSYNPILFIISICCSLPIIFVRLKTSQNTFQVQEEHLKIERKLNYIENILLDKYLITDIRSWQAQQRMKEQIMQESKNMIEQESKVMFKNSMKEGMVESTATMVAFILSILFSIYLSISQNMPLSGIVIVIESVFLLQEEIINIAFNSSYIMLSLRWAKKYFEFMDIDSEKIKKFIMNQNMIVEMKNVAFRYNDCDRDVLNNISLKIYPHQKIALIGENGSGKTTLAKLLLGLYSPTSGKINWNASSESSVLMQDFSKYELSIKKNIIISDITRKCKKKYESVVYQMGIDKWIETLPHKDETFLGNVFEESVNISGGQWQLLALSRAIYRKNTLLILDEPNAALDPITEKAIFDNLFSKNNDGAFLVISHRFLAMNLMDRIYVMENGRIIEEGTHDALMKKKGKYYEMYKVQQQWYDK